MDVNMLMVYLSTMRSVLIYDLISMFGLGAQKMLRRFVSRGETLCDNPTSLII